MAVQVKPNGITTATAPLLLTRAPYITQASIYYVDSITGSDANTGLLQEKPKATVFGASGALSVATGSASTLIVCLSTHRETVSTSYAWGTIGAIVVSLGSGTNRATFTSSVAGIMLDMTGANAGECWLENLIFAASTGVTTARISTDEAGLTIKDCQFNCGANDTADTVLITGSVYRRTVTGCTFTVTAAGAARGLRINSGGSHVEIEDCTFDGGAYGWAGDACGFVTTACPLFRISNLTLSNYSDLNIGITGCKGRISGLTADATSSWQWTP